MINNLYSCLSSLDGTGQENGRFYFCTHENTLEITKTRSSIASSGSFVLLGSAFPSDSSQETILGTEDDTTFLEVNQLPEAGLQVPEEGLDSEAADETELVNSLAELDSHLVQVEEFCPEPVNSFNDHQRQIYDLDDTDRHDVDPESVVEDDESAEADHQSIEVDHQSIEVDHQSIEADHHSIEADQPGVEVADGVYFSSKEAETTGTQSGKAFRYKCDYCPYATNKKSNCSMHVRCVHLREKFTCQICDKQVANLNQHMRLSHQVYKTEGDHCSLCNKSSHNLESHNSKTHKIRVQNDVTCQVCNKDFVHRSNLVRHLAIHNNAKFYCQTCDVHVSDLVKHNSSFHPLPSGYPFICGICGLEFTKKSVLLSHRLKHCAKSSKAAEKFCTICNKHFANINQHIKIVHKKIKNFECVNCKKKFYDKRELRNHHLKYLKNGVCLKSVSTSADARYQCSMCQYKCSKRFNLQMHQQSVHLGIKFECPACGKELSSRPNLNLHMKNCRDYTALHGSAREAGRIVFLCKLCEYETTRASHLDRHILSVHPTEAVETVTSVYEASKTVPSMYGPGPDTSKETSALIEQFTSKHLKLPQFANLAHLETSHLLGSDHHLHLTRRLSEAVAPSSVLSFPPLLDHQHHPSVQDSLAQLELDEDHPASSQLVLEQDHSASIPLGLLPATPNPAAHLTCEDDLGVVVSDASEFVNPAQLVNQPVGGRRHQRMDLTIGQPRHQHHHQLMELSSSSSQLKGGGGGGERAGSPLGSPSAGLMCSTLGDLTAPEDAALFSLPLPLSSDMNS